jgi:hypothetical protein
MGAVLSAFAALAAVLLAKVLGIKPLKDAA